MTALNHNFNYLFFLFQAQIDSWIIFSKFLEIYNKGSLKQISDNVKTYFNIV